MIKYEIHFDENKIKTDGYYTPEHLYYVLDTIMNELHFKKTGNGTYMENGTDDEIETAITVLIFTLFSEDWFVQYADKWLSYEDGEVEDVLSIQRKVALRNKS